MSERDEKEVLFLNERFYAAFAAGDEESMAAIWGREERIACLHPGWEPLIGRDLVLQSWEAILQSPPPIRCVSPSTLPLGRDGMAVLCWEEIGGEFLIATNLYRLEAGEWRLVSHQAGPVRSGPITDPDEEDTPIN